MPFIETLTATVQQSIPSVDDLRALHAALQPSIGPFLKWTASPALAAMALSRAVHGGKRAQLGFIALSAGSMVCFIALLWETGMGKLGDNPSVALSVISSIALASVPVLFLFRVDPQNLARHVIVALLGSSGSLYFLVQHASTKWDELGSTVATMLAAAGVVAWSRQTNFFRMMLFAGAWAMIIVPQYGFYDGDAMLLDMARCGALFVALLLATTGVEADKGGQDKDDRDEIVIPVGPDKATNSDQPNDLKEAA